MRADNVRAGRDAREDALLAREPQGHLDRLVVADRLEVVDLGRIPVRHDEPGPPLDEKRAALAAADRRGPRRLVRLNEHPVRPERLRDAHDRARGAHAVAEGSHAAFALLPDLSPEL